VGPGTLLHLSLSLCVSLSLSLSLSRERERERGLESGERGCRRQEVVRGEGRKRGEQEYSAPYTFTHACIHIYTHIHM
jgi:hypothetical protein